MKFNKKNIYILPRYESYQILPKPNCNININNHLSSNSQMVLIFKEISVRRAVCETSDAILDV